jgi:putative endonuclease
METTHEKGASAEELAVQYLITNGYEILDRNWRHHHFELDIVAKKDKIVAIVEVKSLAYNFIQEPFQSVNRNKQRMVIAATNAYIRRFNINDEVRFDIISILVNRKEPKIEHIENAFYPRVK